MSDHGVGSADDRDAVRAQWPRADDRVWWLSGDDRDRLADEQDRLADQNTEAATERDRVAEDRDRQSLRRQHAAGRRIVATLARLQRAEIRDAHRWAQALASAAAERVAHLRIGTAQSRAAWEQADVEADERVADLIEGGLERDMVQADTDQAAQLLAATADDRHASAVGRAAAHRDRQAAALDRQAARHAREEAAIDRARD